MNDGLYYGWVALCITVTSANYGGHTKGSPSSEGVFVHVMWLGDACTFTCMLHVPGHGGMRCAVSTYMWEEPLTEGLMGTNVAAIALRSMARLNTSLI